MWITKDWKSSWYDKEEIHKMIQNGYTPIFIYYYFGDEISPRTIREHQKEYFSHLRRFKNFLASIDGEKIVILNPEFNQNGAESDPYMDTINTLSIITLKELPDLLVGVCVGDFGDYTKLWDETNWRTFDLGMRFSAKAGDFVAFQQMRALSRNTAEEIRRTALRSLAFATYLHKRYKKPTFLAYLAISSCRDEELQAQTLESFIELLPLMRAAGELMGLNFFHYQDDPDQKGYFGECERHFGLKGADGKAKKGFDLFKALCQSAAAGRG